MKLARLPLRRHAHALVIGISLSLAGAACGDDGGSAEVPLSEVNAAYAAAFCAQLVACATPGSPDASALREMARTEMDGCIARAESLVPLDIAARVAAGRVTYDGRLARECFDAVAMTCGDGIPSIAACEGTVVGLVAVGGTCSDEVECAGDAFCDRGDGDWRCDGACAPKRARGEACEASSECSDAEGPSRCDFSSNTCVPTPTPATALPGEACGTRQSSGGPQAVGCGNGYVCALDDTAGERRCVAIVAEGGSCDGPAACDAGLLCQDLGDGPKCHPFLVTQVEGGPCNETDEDEQALACNVFKGLACGESAMCVRATGGQGSPCRDGLLPCSSGFWCGDEDICLPTVADGEACDSDEACVSRWCGPDDTCGALVCE